MPGFMPGIHVLLAGPRRGWPGIGERSDAVLRTAMPGHDAVVLSPISHPSHKLFDLCLRRPLDTGVRPRAAEERDGEQDLVGTRRVGDRNRHRIHLAGLER